MIRAIRFFFALLRHPKTLELSQDQAEYIEGLFMGGADPEAIARGVNATYRRESFAYFQIPNAVRDGFEFGPADLYVEGCEYLRSAMVKLGAIEVHKENGRTFDFYNAAHPMVKKIASIAAEAPIPESKRRA